MRLVPVPMLVTSWRHFGHTQSRNRHGGFGTIELRLSYNHSQMYSAERTKEFMNKYVYIYTYIYILWMLCKLEHESKRLLSAWLSLNTKPFFV